MEKLKLNKKILVFCDLDGTALNNAHEFDKETIYMVKRLYEKGHYFIPVTARLTDDAIRQAQTLGLSKYNGIVAANNGAQIYDFKNNKFIKNETLSDNFINEIFKKTFGLTGKYKVNYYSDKTTYVYCEGKDTKLWTDIMKSELKVINNYNDITERINRIAVILKKNASVSDLEEFEKDFDIFIKECDVTSYSKRVHEFCPRDCNKGTVPITVLEHLGINRKDTTIFAFGDNYNDIPMLSMADYGVVMDNATPEIKGYGDFITENNNELGVANFIKKRILMI
ncbi:Cof-type HAD-IIB family hydrolase [Spiroplasma endosymbiont of Aspidapion aeneum]|uniref:Cof-type HAD-IIB family hydrolase n=1 Tax=Spiroplasma endosymbiont of Aspidapion aeneum TaxID=3066276 RepID=UPI00313DFEF7